MLSLFVLFLCLPINGQVMIWGDKGTKQITTTSGNVSFEYERYHIHSKDEYTMSNAFTTLFISLEDCLWKCSHDHDATCVTIIYDSNKGKCRLFNRAFNSQLSNDMRIYNGKSLLLEKKVTFPYYRLYFRRKN